MSNMNDRRGWVAQRAMDNAWLSQTKEDIIEPSLEIVDPHHHLWARPGGVYELDHLWDDTESGHHVVQTLFIECRAQYHEDGPEHLRPLGETAYVLPMIEASRKETNKAQIMGIVGRVDLTHPLFDEALDAHVAMAGPLFKGIRQAPAFDQQDMSALAIPGHGPENLLGNDDYRAGVARLGERGLTFDTWHYHTQNQAFRDFAEAIKGTRMILDHFGTPLGVGRFTGKREEVFAQWKDDIAAIAEQPHVFAKLGGLAMIDNGWGFHERDKPIGSDEFAELMAPWYLHTIDCFGPERCMFESNFPVDRPSVGYHVLYNAFKKLTQHMSKDDRANLFSGTARHVYSIPKP